MNTSATNVHPIESAPSFDGVTAGAQQLTLLDVEPDTRAARLPSSATARSVHARFRLSKETRELGLQRVAEIRRRLEANRTRREADEVSRLPHRTSTTPSTAA